MTAAQQGLTQERASPEDGRTSQGFVRAKEIEEAQELIRKVALHPEQPTQFDALSIEEIQAEIELRQRARRAALVLRVDATLNEYQVGARGRSLSTVLAAYTDLAEFDLERAASAADRVRSLQPIVDASRRIENEVRAKTEFGAAGGEFSSLMEATANRLKWEHQLAKEVLAMKRAGTK